MKMLALVSSLFLLAGCSARVTKDTDAGACMNSNTPVEYDAANRRLSLNGALKSCESPYDEVELSKGSSLSLNGEVLAKEGDTTFSKTFECEYQSCPKELIFVFERGDGKKSTTTLRMPKVTTVFKVAAASIRSPITPKTESFEAFENYSISDFELVDLDINDLKNTALTLNTAHNTFRGGLVFLQDTFWFRMIGDAQDAVLYAGTHVAKFVFQAEVSCKKDEEISCIHARFMRESEPFNLSLQEPTL